MAIDPVCGMEIDEATAEDLGAEVVEHGGRRYYFCSPYCRDAFLRAPERYTGRDAAQAAEADHRRTHGDEG